MKLVFMAAGRKMVSFEVENKVVKYFDDFWKDGIQIYPKDQNLIEKLRRSGKHNLKMMAALILDANKGKELKEYEKCKTDEDVVKIIRKDCKSKGLVEV